MANTNSSAHVRVIEETPAYWRVVFDYPPLTWPETQQRIQALLKRGLQRDGDFELRWPEALGALLET